MNFKKLLSMLLLSLCFAAIAHAQYIGQEQQQEDQGTEPVFEAWCANGTRSLERAQRIASGQIANGQFHEAASTLVNALQSGVNRPIWNIKPITWRLMNHGNRLGSTMLAAAGNDTRAVKATVNALEGMYDLLLESAYEIDRAYYRTRCGYCRARGVRAFDLRVQRMVGDMLALVNGHMTYARRGQVFPLGPARAYLVGAEVVSDGAAGELEQLVFAESLGCEIVELDEVSRELASFNRRSSSESEKIGMFYDTYDRLDGVIAELRAGRGCY